jgi:hypothetical protein
VFYSLSSLYLSLSLSLSLSISVSLSLSLSIPTYPLIPSPHPPPQFLTHPHRCAYIYVRNSNARAGSSTSGAFKDRIEHRIALTQVTEAEAVELGAIPGGVVTETHALQFANPLKDNHFQCRLW